LVKVTVGKKNLRKTWGKAAIAKTSSFNLAFLGNLKRIKYVTWYIVLSF
jgi:hypothetical protein